MFTAPVVGWKDLPAFAREDDQTQLLDWRVRSYLAVNSVQCHQPGGVALGHWDARPTTATGAAHLIDGALVNDGGDPAERWAVPGDPHHSMVLRRLNGTAARMRPLATSEVDPNAIRLVSEWINRLRSEGTGARHLDPKKTANLFLTSPIKAIF